MKKPKIIIWDLETMPNPEEVIKRLPGMGAWPGRTLKSDLNSIICFGYKEYGKKRAKCVNGWDFQKDWKKDRHNDYNVVKAAYDILKDADGIVTHNGTKFDVKVLNTRLKYHGLPRLPKIHHTDTVRLARSNLSLFSNSLSAVAKFLNCTDKMQVNNKWDLWVKLSMGKDTKKTRDVMTKYCKQDVDTLEEVYEELKQYHTSHVNFNAVAGTKENCPTCGSTHTQKYGTKITKTGKKQRYQCQDCAAVFTKTPKGVAKC